MSRPASQPATQGFRPISLGECLALMSLFAGVGFGAYNLKGCNTPTPPTPPTLHLQWGEPEGCWLGFTRVRIENWLGDGPEPPVCKLVPPD